MSRKYPIRICSVEGCVSPFRCRGWCEKHYKRWLTHGNPNTSLQSDCKGSLCSSEGCTRTARKQLLCGSHYTKLWRINNPELARLNMRHFWNLRDQRRRGAVGSHTREEWEALKSRYENRCAYCLSGGAESKDHVVPLVHGGTNSIANILPACLYCNKSRGAKPLIDWLREKNLINTFNDYEARYNGKTYRPQEQK